MLLEHKSHPDRQVLIQLLELILRIWRRHGPEAEVVPILVTNTPRAWPDPLDLRALLGKGRQRPEFVPSFEVLHVSLTDLEVERVGQAWDLRAGLRVLGMVARGETDERLGKVFEEAARGSWREGKEEFVEVLLAYVTRGKMKLGPEELRAVVEKVLGIGGAGIMESLAEVWFEEGKQKGREEGWRQGREEGLRRGLADSVCEVLAVRFGRVPEEVEAFVRTRREVEELKELLRRAAVVRNPEELLVSR